MLAVAHVQRRLFELSETFIYNYLTAFRRVLPVGITLGRLNVERFPVDFPMLQLVPSRLQALVTEHMTMEWAWNRFFRGGYFHRDTFAALEQYRVRALHAHFGPNGFCLLPIKRATGLPLVTTFYGQDMSMLPRKRRWRRRYAQLFAGGDLFLVEGMHMREKLLALGSPPEKTAIQRISLHIERYPFRERAPKTSNQPVTLLFCGRFSEKKGLLYALDAVQRLRHDFANLELRIVGDGAQRPQVEAFLDRHNMRAYTTLLGYQSHQRMIAEMDAADIFLSPSVTAADGDSEGGAPTSILEAQACGMPVLSSYHADIPNVVVPGASALLAPERNTMRLVELLGELLSNPACWSEMGRRGRRFVETHHDVAPAARRLEDRYFALIGHE
jgi:colanic acid/amylovoran biosynthesis glycosyltransferase